MSYIMLELSDSLNIWLRLNIAYGSAYFNNSYFSFFAETSVETTFNFIGNVGDNLNCSSAKVTTSLLFENGPINLTSSYVRIFC